MKDRNGKGEMRSGKMVGIGFHPLPWWRRLLGCAGLPVFCMALMWVLCAWNGTSLFGGSMTGFFKSICYFSLLCYAVSINLHTGRMSFDVGSIILLSTVLGFLAGIGSGDKVWVAMGVSIVAGCAFALLSGALYLALRLPMMIVSLGTTLIFEAVAFWIVKAAAYGGNVEAIALRATQTPSLFWFGEESGWMAVITLLAVLFMVWIFHYTTFGYDYRALQTGQKIAVNVGVGESRNALICFAVAGVMMGAAGIVNFTDAHAVQPSINFGTVPLMFECFCPLFFGGFLNRYVNKQVGILLGVIAYSFIQLGLGQIRIVQNWNNYVIPLINAAILVVFMIWQTGDWGRFGKREKPKI